MTDQQWSNLKPTMTESAYNNVGKETRKSEKKPCSSDDMIESMEMRRRWESGNTNKDRRKYQCWNNKVRRGTDQAKKYG